MPAICFLDRYDAKTVPFGAAKTIWIIPLPPTPHPPRGESGVGGGGGGAVLQKDMSVGFEIFRMHQSVSSGLY